jgi:hypothetical protein
VAGDTAGDTGTVTVVVDGGTAAIVADEAIVVEGASVVPVSVGSAAFVEDVAADVVGSAT